MSDRINGKTRLPAIHQLMERHTTFMTHLQSVADACAPADQRYIILVYDGPDIIGERQLSYHAGAATSNDVREICAALVRQIGHS